MTNTPEVFLSHWTKAFLSADPRDRGSMMETIALCAQDAGRDGISEHDLTEAAGGDLKRHFEHALMLA
jgi:hypothetical protein